VSLLSMPVAEAAARALVLRRLELAVQGRLDGLESGDYLTSALGPGSERAGARRYQAGDDARSIDWNLTARSDSAWVRQTEADRELETWLVADTSASLDFGTADGEKRDVILGAAAAYAMLTVRGGNRLGLILTGGDRLRHVPARRGRTAMLAALAVLHDAPRQSAAPVADADLAAGLKRLRVVQSRRSQVVVLSDFLSDDAWSEPLAALGRHHQVVAVHVSDPRELALPDVGILAVIDTETGRQRYVQTGSTALRARYAAAAAARQADIARRIDRAGADYLHVTTDRDWLTDVVRHVTSRRRSRRAGTTDAIRRFGAGVAR
jgi:uncharacterized protein (DUF58 family)